MKAKEYYSYALDGNNCLISAKDARKGLEYRCPCCGAVMIPRQGKIREWHFAHKSNPENCSYETYLHKIAKIRIRECFEKSSQFTMSFHPKVICNVPECPLGVSKPCEWNRPESHDLKKYYNSCEEEVQVGNYRADLLLTNSERPERGPILIEIWVSHKSTKEKLQSGYRIIEIKIESEADIDSIVSEATIRESEGYLDDDKEKPNEQIKFYNFKEYKDIPDDKHQRDKYSFWIVSKDYFKLDRYGIVKCLNSDNKGFNSSIFRIASINPINWDFAFQKLLESGLGIKYCTMCRFYRRNDYYCRSMCILYRSKEIAQYPQLSDAMKCPHFKPKDYVKSEIDMEQECKITILKE